MIDEGTDARPRPGVWATAAAVFIVTGVAAWWVHWQSGAPMRETLELVRQSLRDPASAEFRNIRETTNGVCGEVNAKNGFGGMTGFEPFYVSTISAASPHVWHDRRMVDTMCNGG